MALPKGNMIPIKKILGAILLITGGFLLFNFDSAMAYIHRYPMVFSIILLVAGYFLFIAGRRRR